MRGSIFHTTSLCQCTQEWYPGMGYGLLPMLAGVAELAGRGITAMAAAAHKSYFGACMASPMAWVLAGGLLIVMYFYVMKDMKRRLGL